jgi:hypothetical protein
MEQVLGSSSRDVIDPPIPGGHGITTSERATTDLSSMIPGWGSDLDAANRPGVPRDKAPELGAEVLYAPIRPQVPKIKIHKSTEHPRLTPVFGTSCPPRGFSGMIRDFAYKFSEGRHTHWLLLVVADRIDVIESLFSDLLHGHVPNIPKEMGLATELRYNRGAFVRKTAIIAGCIGLLAGYLWYRTRR